MAHDPHATALIKNLKAAKKNAEDKVAPYFERFIAGNEVPTKKDVEDFKKLLTSIKQMSDVMWADVNECRGAIESFGGPGDRFFNTERVALQTLTKKAR
jgi:hypothetical protein